MKSKLFLAAALAVIVTAGGAYAKPDANQMAAVADKARPEADSKRDADRKPAEMLEFAGVKQGQTVVDLIPGGGYFTRIFSKAVGAKGTVYAVGGPPRPADPSKPAPPPPAQDTIAADANYSNVKSIHAPLAGGLSIPTKADLVWTAQNYHDVKNVAGIDMLAFDKAIFDSLKPGGVFVVLDHAAAPGAMVTNTLHRIDPAVVKKEVEAAGFKFEGESKVLASAADDHTKAVFDPSLRGHTDQFIYKFRKPK
ncbi:MAG TPA: methyltransferase [Phenylobacterium sp.]|jgi:predicted methyltransferase|nr:methyltransferase [Phenylobacterium sp.]